MHGAIHDERADIELAVSCPTAAREDWARIWRIVGDAPTLLHVDLVRLAEAAPPIRRSIEAEGRVLY